MARTIARTPVGRMLVVFAASAVVLSGGILAAHRASSAPRLPSVGARDLVASAIRAIAKGPSVSGDVTTHLDLGLPQLPNVEPDRLTGPAAFIEYVSGDHHLRVWSSKDGIRIADLLPAAERSIVVGRTVAWAWDSATLTAYRFAMPSGGANRGIGPRYGATGRGLKPSDLLNPETLASRSLAVIGPTTSVTVSENRWIAGRPTYALVLRPRTNATLVGKIEIDLDSATRLPLRAAVYARGAGAPAVSASFTHVSFAAIPASEFEFRPPPGAKVVDVFKGARHPLPSSGRTSLAPRSASSTRRHVERLERARLRDYVRFFGSGWAAVTAYRLPPVASLQKSSGTNLRQLLPFSATLFSADLVARGDHSWLLVGAVPQSALVRVAPRLP